MNTRTTIGLGGLVLALSAAAANGGSLTWTAVLDNDPGNLNTRSLRGLALSDDETVLYGGYIQGSSTAGFTRWTLAGDPPVGASTNFWNVTLGANGASSSGHQAEAVATDSRGIVYGASVLDSTGGDNARIFVFDGALGTPTIFPLADVTFFGTSGDTVGDLAVRETGGTIQLYVTRFRNALNANVVERYVVGGTGVGDATLTLDLAFNGSGQFAVPGASRLRGIDVADDGTMFIASREAGRVHRVSADLFSVTTVLVPFAMDVALHTNSRVYVTQYDGEDSAIVELRASDLAATGTVHTATTAFPRGTSAGYAGIDIDADGRIHLVDQIYATNSDRVLVSSPLPQTVNVRFEPDQQTVFDGDEVLVDVVVESSGTMPQSFQSLDAVLAWDPARLKLLGSTQDNAGAVFAAAGFPSDPGGLNASLADGDALFRAEASLGTPPVAPVAPSELVVTTLKFLAIAPTPGTSVDLLPALGPFATTNVQNLGVDITGDIATAADVIILDPVNVTVKIELAGVWAGAGPLSVERCITFELHETGGTTTTLAVPVTFVSAGPGSPAAATITLIVENLPYDCMTARDTLHTLRRTDDDDFGPFGGGFQADFTDRSGIGGDDDSLVGGDLNDDGVVDVLDEDTWLLEFGTNYGTGDTDCANAGPNADVNGDGVADMLDFVFFIRANDGATDDPGCPIPLAPASTGSGAGPATGAGQAVTPRSSPRLRTMR